MRWGFYLGNVDFLKEHQLAVCSADSRNWTQTAAATECRNPLLTKHIQARSGGFCQTASSSHPHASKSAAPKHIRITSGSAEEWSCSSAPSNTGSRDKAPVSREGTRLLSQEKHHPVKIGTNLNSIKDQITLMHITTQSTNYGINGA